MFWSRVEQNGDRLAQPMVRGGRWRSPGQDAPQMLLAKYDNMIEALTPD
jgi:hypothetical protein